MPSKRELDRLEDIRNSIELAQQFTSGMTYEQFEVDTRSVFAVIRCLEIVSEASRHLGSELKARHAELPWLQIAGAGNVYRHDYPDVRPQVLWQTVQSALPELLAAVEAELTSGA
jgi:uncharacterized protein with HEPN domain